MAISVCTAEMMDFNVANKGHLLLPRQSAVAWTLWLNYSWSALTTSSPKLASTTWLRAQHHHQQPRRRRRPVRIVRWASVEEWNTMRIFTSMPSSKITARPCSTNYRPALRSIYGTLKATSQPQGTSGCGSRILQICIAFSKCARKCIIIRAWTCDHAIMAYALECQRTDNLCAPPGRYEILGKRRKRGTPPCQQLRATSKTWSPTRRRPNIATATRRACAGTRRTIPLGIPTNSSRASACTTPCCMTQVRRPDFLRPANPPSFSSVDMQLPLLVHPYRRCHTLLNIP